VRVLTVDGSEIFRLGVRAALVGVRDLELVAEAADAHAAEVAADIHRPDVIVADLEVYERDAFSLASTLRGIVPAARILVLSARATEANVKQALLAGASGCTSKGCSAGELLTAIREVGAGRSVRPTGVKANHDGAGRGSSTLDRLSTREREIFELIIWGQTNKQVALRLGISVKTVETHRSHINGKLQVHSAAELVRLASLCGALAPGAGPEAGPFAPAPAPAQRLVAKIS
jgi:two-component system, NarL family, response regulator NreC